MKHDGKYIPKQFKVGRAVPLTGIWDCCGNTLQLSLYCESKESRKVMKLTLEASKRTSDVSYSWKYCRYLYWLYDYDYDYDICNLVFLFNSLSP
jgi:hypothetical protein